MCPVYTPPGTPSPLWGVTHAAITAVHKNARSLAENFPAEQSLIPVDRSYSLFPIPYSLFPIPCSLFPAFKKQQRPENKSQAVAGELLGLD
jgi:hypothetical protein